jgi:enoyl-[acyl-carrier protein] reductase / trans-2-enoyl-CoA reductase (NAD+)
MIIKPKVRGFICTTSHPKGCEKSVLEQIAYVKENGMISSGPKNVLIIGGSTGYGLASRIATAFGSNSKTLSVSFEKEPDQKRTASAGWYNTIAFEKQAKEAGLYARSLNGDAFSNEMKEKVADIIEKDLGKVDLVVYSLASPRRVHPDTGEVFNSVLKPIGTTYSNKTVDPLRGVVKGIDIEAAEGDDIKNTIEVMGGEDWEMWVDYLLERNLLDNKVITVAYSYIGPSLTHPIYKDGTIGMAKNHLNDSALKISNKLENALNGLAFVSVNKALVTQASSAIPVVPLYISILYKLMKENNTHEGCIEQMSRLFSDQVYSGVDTIRLDENRQLRLDDLEMDVSIQNKITDIWNSVNTENLQDLTDIDGYKDDFYKLFGFGFDGVDYDEDIPLI